MDTRCHQEPLEFSHFDGTSSSGRPQIALDSGERPAGLLRRRSPPLAGATQGFDTFQWENGWRMDGTWMENGWKMDGKVVVVVLVVQVLVLYLINN
jgi:hypothetical protein